MKRYIKLFGALVLSLIIISLTIAKFNFWPSSEPFDHLALEVTVNQSSENSLQLRSMQIVNQYPQSEIPAPVQLKKYYLVQVLDEQDRPLFSTRVSKTEVLSFFTAPNYRQRAPIAYFKKEIYLFLPVYRQAVNLRFRNERGEQVLLVNIKGIINQRKDAASVNLCGNGLCDQRENFLNCFRDCQLK